MLYETVSIQLLLEALFQEVIVLYIAFLILRRLWRGLNGFLHNSQRIKTEILNSSTVNNQQQNRQFTTYPSPVHNSLNIGSANADISGFRADQTFPSNHVSSQYCSSPFAQAHSEPLLSTGNVSPYEKITGKQLIEGSADIPSLNFSVSRTEILNKLLPTLRTHVINSVTFASAFDVFHRAKRGQRQSNLAIELESLLHEPTVTASRVKSLILTYRLHPVRVHQLVAYQVQQVFHGDPILTPTKFKQFLSEVAIRFPYLSLVDFTSGMFVQLCMFGPMASIPQIDLIMQLGAKCPDFPDFCDALQDQSLKKYFVVTPEHPRWVHPLDFKKDPFWHSQLPEDSNISVSKNSSSSSSTTPLNLHSNSVPIKSRSTSSTTTLSPKQPQVSCHTIDSIQSSKPLAKVKLTFSSQLTLDATIDISAEASLISENLVSQLGFLTFIEYSSPSSAKNSPKPLRKTLMHFSLPHNPDIIHSQVFEVITNPDILHLSLDFWKKFPDLLSIYSKEYADTYTTTALSCINDQLIVDAVTKLRHSYPDSPLTLPPRRDSDYRFDLTVDSPNWRSRPLPQLTLEDSSFMCEEVGRLLAAQFIAPVQPTKLYSVSFITRQANRPHMTIDYRQLNDITVPLSSSIDSFQTLTREVHGSIFSTLSLKQAYQHLRLDPITQSLTTFNTKFGYFCWQVLPTGLSNAPELFCRFITSLMSPFSEFTRCYLDDILVFSPDFESHKKALHQVCSLLSENGLHLDFEKCNFFKSTVTWVGYTFTATSSGVEVTPQSSTIQTIRAISPPKTKKDVQNFLGHLAYMSAFNPNLSLTAPPLAQLLKSGARFDWTLECQAAFEQLRKIEIEFFALHPFQHDLPIKITTDASSYAVGAALWQKHDLHWYPVAYRSSKLNDLQLNWTITDKELYAILFATRAFHYFIANGQKIVVQTDHKALVRIFKSDNPNPKYLHWIQEMIPYRLEIDYIPGNTNTVADYLSRPPISITPMK